MNAALSIALLELATLGVLSVPLLVMQPDQGLSILVSTLAGAVLGRWIVARWLLPREAALPRPSEWIWSLGVGAGLIARTALLLSAACALLGWPVLALTLAVVVLGWALSGRWRWVEGLLALPLLVGLVWSFWDLGVNLNGGWDTYGRVFVGARKHLPLNFQLDAASPSSLFSGLCLGSLHALVLLGIDPLVRDRLTWSGPTLADARRTLWWSLLYLLPLAGLVLIGVALFAWQEREPLADGSQAWLARMQAVANPAAVWALGLGLGALALQGVRAWLGHGTGRLQRVRQLMLAGALIALVHFSNLPLEQGLLAARVAWGVVGAWWMLQWVGVQVRASDWVWALALTSALALALHGGAEGWLRAFLLAGGLAWLCSRTLIEFFGHRRRLAASIDLLLVTGLLVSIDWLTRHHLVAVAKNPFHDEGWNWLPLSGAWYVPLSGAAFFALCCWFARHRADQRGMRG